ncbi:MAG TPA: hypothetical protein DCF62_08255 [Porticoccaceae bacterium]|nr:hypothetical protein [Porticoccaceae bacterium]HCO61814.1 hypothetical protein [Porticoccaceae bacterium]
MTKPGSKFLHTAMLGIGIAATIDYADAESDLRLHPVEHYRIQYEQTGMMTGTIERGCRNWCAEQVEITNTTVSMMGVTQKTRTRAVTVGDKIYNINLENGKATVTTNPMYATIVQQIKNSGNDPKQVAKAWLKAMGFSSTGNARAIAGETCTDYTGMGGMATSCMTDDGLMLRTEAMGMVQTATDVDRSSGGNSADYQIPTNAQAVQIPGIN